MPSKFFCLTTVWGNYIDMFLKGTLKSLSLPSNQKAMEDAIWNIFTEEENFERLDEAIAKALPETQVKLRDLSKIRDRIDYLHSALVWQIKECIAEDKKMLLIPPDSLFGDQTIKNLKTLGKEKGSCVLVPHPRVLPTILSEDFKSNEDLVRLSWKHLHRSWTDSEEGSDRQNSFIGGVSWERLDDKTISVKHLLPTPYYCDFTNDDLKFFDAQGGIGVIDHVWPSMLVQQGRVKFSGSSDACFIAEITEADKNLPPVKRGEDQSKFWKQHPHNVFNSQIACIFRSN